MTFVTNKIVEFKLDLSREQQHTIDDWLDLSNWIWNRGLALLNWHEYWHSRQECQYFPKIKRTDSDVELPQDVLQQWGFVSWEQVSLAPLRNQYNELEILDTDKKGKPKRDRKGNLKTKKQKLWLKCSDRTTVKRISINEYPGYNDYHVEVFGTTKIYSGIPGLPNAFIEERATSKGTRHYLHSPGIKPVKFHWAKEPPFDYSGTNPEYSIAKLFSKEQIAIDPHVSDDIKTRFATIHSKFVAGLIKRLGGAWKEYKTGKRGKPRFKKRHSDSICSLTDGNAAKREKLTEADKAKQQSDKEAWNAKKEKLKAAGQPDIGTYKPPKQPLIGSTWQTEGNRVKIPKLGWLQVKGLQERWGDRFIVNGRMLKEASGYYLQLTGEFEANLKQVVLHRSDGELQGIGIDAGVVSLFVDDSGREMMTRSDNLDVSQLSEKQKRYRRENKKIKRLQSQLNRRKTGSNNWKKTSHTLQKIHEHKRRRGRASDHKITTRLIRQYDGIACEKLNLQGMTAAPKTKITEDGKTYAKNRSAQKAGLNRGILGNTPGRRAEMLIAKAEEINGAVSETVREVVKVDPKNTSRECRVCGHTEKDNRPTQAKFQCLSCGHTENADINAARNILKRALDASNQSDSVFSRSYRAWAWEVKPVRDTPVSDGDVPSGESQIATMRQEAAAFVVDAGATAPQAEICHTTLTTLPKNNACAEGEVSNPATPKKSPETFTTKGLQGDLSAKSSRATPETLVTPKTQTKHNKPKPPKRGASENKSPPAAQSLSGTQLELDLWG